MIRAVGKVCGCEYRVDHRSGYRLLRMDVYCEAWEGDENSLAIGEVVVWSRYEADRALEALERVAALDARAPTGPTRTSRLEVE